MFNKKFEATEEVVMIEIDNKEYEIVAGLGYIIPADIAQSQGFIYIDENLEDIEELELGGNLPTIIIDGKENR